MRHGDPMPATTSMPQRATMPRPNGNHSRSVSKRTSTAPVARRQIKVGLPLHALGLPARVRTKLLDAALFHAADIKPLTSAELALDLAVSDATVRLVRTQAMVPDDSIFTSCTTLLATPSLPPMSTGIAPFDTLLNGGFARSAISELSGASGAGKSAILAAMILHLLRTPAPSAPRIVALDTDGALTSTLRTAYHQHPHLPWPNLDLRRIHDLPHLVDTVSTISSQTPPTLLIIDAVTTHLASFTDLVARARAVHVAAQAVRGLAVRNGTAVVLAARQAEGPAVGPWTAVAGLRVAVKKGSGGKVGVVVVKGDRMGRRAEWRVDVEGVAVEQVVERRKVVLALEEEEPWEDVEPEEDARVAAYGGCMVDEEEEERYEEVEPDALMLA
ncbi:hypothetical protein AMAG_16983 [Allomyces macrogynus ATCC 38327]|uniref:Rad51-like C-terminal domain-containing protein n=1 Tax=Allomyces macrogynus (strain ATCC 38327) TaxID=578462 RepID=A0A0L0TCI1_ALLM3|nr:hypothetical protein AMAG_16983 [Allomyces macrogynus ATCC 38327]|eukprot:KNE72538.1 hypothetical protein AMAG_16983 [Allomyces macrogynus ATCC 38327]